MNAPLSSRIHGSKRKTSILAPFATAKKNPVTTDTHMKGFFDGADVVAKAMASTITAATQGVPVKAPVPLPELVFVK